MIPYWLRFDQAIPNDVVLSHGNIMFLTGSNNGGKSTLTRSMMSLALLANSGLTIPAADAIVPRFRGYFMRTGGQDVPKEGRSSFAVEMSEMRVMLRDCDERSLVMIDELGKGTSSRDGVSVVGALLESLVSQKARGVLCSHLSQVARIPLNLKNRYNPYDNRSIDDKPDVVYMKMGTKLDHEGKCLFYLCLIE